MSTDAILCFSRASLQSDWLPEQGALAISWEALHRWLSTQCHWCWMERAAAEEDPCWKQPIPYVLACDSRGHIAAYRRRGTERRLHGLWSLGIGGHVEGVDAHADLGETLLACARREIQEELQCAPDALQFLGILNEEQTAVGHVHWGLVFKVHIADPPAFTADLGHLCWLSPEDAMTLPLECWSRLAMELLARKSKLATADDAPEKSLSSNANPGGEP